MSEQTRKPVVVVIGPLSGTGGMATSMRRQLSSGLADKYHLVPFDSSKRTPLRRSLWQGLCSQWSKAGELKRLLVQLHPDMVHIHTCSGNTFYRSVLDLLLARRYGARTLLHLRGGRFVEFLNAAPRLGRWFARQGLLKADRVIALSNGWSERIRSFDSRIRTAVIPNGVPVPERPQRRKQGAPVVVFVGSLSSAKGVDDLIEAVGALSDADRRGLRVRLIGPDPQHRVQELQARIRRLGLQDVFAVLGALEPDIVARELSRGTLFTLPSHAEGLPNALLEAMACGLPAVVSSVGAIPEVLRHEVDGLVVPPADPKALSAGLARLIRDPQLCCRMGAAARRRVRRFYRLELITGALDALYQEALVAGDS